MRFLRRPMLLETRDWPPSFASTGPGSPVLVATWILAVTDCAFEACFSAAGFSEDCCLSSTMASEESWRDCNGTLILTTCFFSSSSGAVAKAKLDCPSGATVAPVFLVKR